MLPAEYFRQAEECLRIAEAIRDPQERATLITLARTWLTLADLAEKYAGAILVYETPERPQQVAQQQQQPQPKSPDKTE
jgi:hypothetical protein